MGLPEFEEVMENFPDLTPSEVRVFLLVGEGLTNKEIADICFISPLTVRTHVKRIHDKLQVEGRGRLAVAGARVLGNFS